VIAVGSEPVVGGTRFVVEGERTAIAHVGGWLVHRGDVPPDLDVSTPGLEEALLALLEHADAALAAAGTAGHRTNDADGRDCTAGVLAAASGAHARSAT
jgi:hypothetical protein